MSRREQLLNTAMELFAQQGYAQTSVAEIQQACGLAPSSGAMYKHFASKRELLEAATEHYLGRLADDRKWFDAESADGDVERALQSAAELVWKNIDNNAELLRIVYSEHIPDLADQLWSAVTANAYQGLAEVLRRAVEAGTLRVTDPDATATVLLASLIHYPLIQLLINHTPGDIEEGRYRAAWLEHARAITHAWRLPG